MLTRLITTTRLCYIGHHTTETSRLHSCCSNMVQISMRGTKRDTHHCTEYWPASMMTSGIVFLIRYSSYLSMARTLMHWMARGQLRSMWHQNMAAPKPHGYCSSMAQISISRTTRAIPPPKLRRRMVMKRLRGCCRRLHRK